MFGSRRITFGSHSSRSFTHQTIQSPFRIRVESAVAYLNYARPDQFQSWCGCCVNRHDHAISKTSKCVDDSHWENDNTISCLNFVKVMKLSFERSLLEIFMFSGQVKKEREKERKSVICVLWSNTCCSHYKLVSYLVVALLHASEGTGGMLDHSFPACAVFCFVLFVVCLFVFWSGD